MLILTSSHEAQCRVWEEAPEACMKTKREKRKGGITRGNDDDDDDDGAKTWKFSTH